MVMLTQLMNQARNCQALPLITSNGPEEAVPLALRRWVLERDGHRCCAPGCHRTRDLEVAQVHPGRKGGHLNPGNLITICPVCRPMWQLMGSGEFHVEDAGSTANELQAQAIC